MKAISILSISLGLIAFVSFPLQAQTEVLRPIVHIENMPLRTAIDSLMKWYDVSIVYLDSDVEGKIVSATCSECGAQDVLGLMLRGTSLTWLRLGNQIILKQKATSARDTVATLSGVVTDSLTGQWISGATVFLQDSSESDGGRIVRWCPTNDFGFYSLANVPFGSYTLTVRALGYEIARIPVQPSSRGNVRCNVEIRPRDIVLQTVTVEGHRVALSSVEGISQGVFLRSVPTDRNQYSLDGGKIFDPTHFGGVLSAFSPEVLNDVQVVLGGIPPSYGGRAGGFVDLSLRDGNRQRLSGSVAAGTLGSTLTLGGPMGGGTTFIVSGRRGYPEATMDYLHAGGSPSRQRFSELVGKVTHRLSGSDQLSLSGYLGGDSYGNQVVNSGLQLDNAFTWNNSMLDGRWIGIVSPSLFLHASATYSHYSLSLQHTLLESSPNPIPNLSSSYGIDDFTLRVNAEGYHDEYHTVRAGAEAIHHTMRGAISAFSSQIASYSLGGFSAWEASVYLQDQWRITPYLLAEIGARATSFLGDEGTFSGVDPRFALRASLDDQSFAYCSLSGINQFIHAYRNSGVFLLYPATFWYSSTDSVRPTTSLTVSLGAQKGFGDDAYFATVECYYRLTNNLHEFGLDTITTRNPDLSSSILFGQGKIAGFVCTLQKRLGQFTGSVSYNLSWAVESFAQINNGKEFSSPFDRRHELQLSARYIAGNRWTVGVFCFAAIGQSSLFPVRTVAIGARANDVGKLEYAATPKATYGEFVDVNGGKLPGFQRLELNVTYGFVWSDAPCQISLRMLNSYGLLDPFIWSLRNSGNLNTRWSVTLRNPALFPLYPALGFNVRF